MVDKITESMPSISNLGGAAQKVEKVGAGQDFSSFMQDATENSIETLKAGEAMGMKGITGNADLNDVVSAINSAESTLQLVTTIRDKMIQAYQEVMRMPI
jgi:flagellar hook-basal body complex protein FliE